LTYASDVDRTDTQPLERIRFVCTLSGVHAAVMAPTAAPAVAIAELALVCYI